LESRKESVKSSVLRTTFQSGHRSAPCKPGGNCDTQSGSSRGRAASGAALCSAISGKANNSAFKPRSDIEGLGRKLRAIRRKATPRQVAARSARFPLTSSGGISSVRKPLRTAQRAQLAFLASSTSRAKCRWARCFNSSTGSSQSLMPICSSVVQPS
jgi:hypothetical protein